MMCSIGMGSKPGYQEWLDPAGSVQPCPMPLSWTHTSEPPHAHALPALPGCLDSAPSSPSAFFPPQPSSAEIPQWRWCWCLLRQTWPSAVPSLQRNPHPLLVLTNPSPLQSPEILPLLHHPQQTAASFHAVLRHPNCSRSLKSIAPHLCLLGCYSNTCYILSIFLWLYLLS